MGDDSGLSDSPRTTPEPVEPEILSLTNFAKYFTFESRISSPESLDVVSNSDKVTNENSEHDSEFHILKFGEKSEEQLKVAEADTNQNSKLGQNFEGPVEYYVVPSLSRYS